MYKNLTQELLAQSTFSRKLPQINRQETQIGPWSESPSLLQQPSDDEQQQKPHKRGQPYLVNELKRTQNRYQSYNQIKETHSNKMVSINVISQKETVDNSSQTTFYGLPKLPNRLEQKKMSPVRRLEIKRKQSSNLRHKDHIIQTTSHENSVVLQQILERRNKSQAFPDIKKSNDMILGIMRKLQNLRKNDQSILLRKYR